MKVVRESINFTRGEDPKSQLGLGIESMIDKWLKDYGLNSHYVINWHADNTERISIDYYGVVNLGQGSAHNIGKWGILWPSKGLPDFIDFRKVHAFDIIGCKIKNMLKKTCDFCVGLNQGYFNASYNDLISFEGFPKKIYGDCSVDNNPRLQSIKGLPKEIGGNLNLSETQMSKESRNYWEEKIKDNCDLGGKIIWHYWI